MPTRHKHDWHQDRLGTERCRSCNKMRHVHVWKRSMWMSDIEHCKVCMTWRQSPDWKGPKAGSPLSHPSRMDSKAWDGTMYDIR